MLNAFSQSPLDEQALLSRFLRLAVIGQVLAAVGMVVLVSLRATHLL